MSNLKQIIEQSFTQYAGAVLQSRALVDVRDCLKPSARQIFYCLYTDKFVHSKPFKKTLKAIGSASRMYIHGDSSAEGILMRAGQPFAMRYPLIEIEGSFGNLMESGNWAAPRYTSSRLTEFSEKMFESIGKNTIEKWLDNYDDTEQYPTVLPTIGFYNIVNGTVGIGIGAASSIPPTNLKEVNTAIIKLIKNPEIDFNEIICYPDFPTGATILNKNEVKESLKKGQGASCKIRSTIEYSSEENCLVVTEIPYMVYTNTICGELETIIAENEDTTFIDHFNDLTGEKPLIKIYLKKGINSKKAIEYLYKNTSLESYYSINFTMLKDGRWPTVFGWKECLQEYITHIRACKRREIEFDLAKAQERLNIVEGLLTAAASIDEVVALIRSSDSPAEASKKLIDRFSFNTEQVKAILAMKLSSLTRIDGIKLNDEKEQLISKIAQFQHLLEEPQLLDAELIKALQEVADKFGDARRTKVINLVEDEAEKEEEHYWTVNYCDNNTLVVTEEKEKFKFTKKLRPVQTIYTSNFSSLFFVTNKGRYYNVSMKTIGLGQHDFNSLYGSQSGEYPVLLATAQDLSAAKSLVFITKEGMVKRSATSEYYGGRVKGANALKLRDTDSVIGAYLSNSDKDSLIVVSNIGRYNHYPISEISETGKVTLGVKAIKLEDKEFIVATTLLKESSTCIELVCIKSSGATEKITVPPITSRGIKGPTLTSVVRGIAPVPLNVTSITLLENGKIQKL